MTDLTKQSNVELVRLHNSMPGAKPLKSWKGKKEELIKRINKVRPDLKEAETPAKKAERDGSIRAYCDELLLKVQRTDEKTKRPIGMPYEDILKAVRKKFPEASTSVNCLRWYATKLNNQHRSKKNPKPQVRLPERPTAPRNSKVA